MKRITYNIAATAALLVGLLPQGIACGPRDRRESTPRPKSPRSGTAPASDPLERCLARVRCYRTIVAYQSAAVRIRRQFLPKAARVRAATLLGQVNELAGANPPTTSAECKTARTRLVRAISLLKVEYTHLVRQFVGLIATRLKHPSEDVRKAARSSLDSLRYEMRRTQRKLTGIKSCQPFARQR
jgi:hypothetical protein